MKQTVVAPAPKSVRAQAHRTPPGPRGGFFSGAASEFHRDRLGFLSRIARDYGDISLMRFGPRRLYFLNHPDYIKRVLMDNYRNYKKDSYTMNIIKLASGENVFTGEGAFWLHERRLMQPTFHRQRIAGFGKLMVDSTRTMLNRWQDVAARGGELEVEHEMMRLTLSVASQSLFSVDLSDKASVLGQAFTATTDYISYRLGHPIAAPLWFPTRRNRKFNGAVRTTDQLVDKLIQARRQNPDGKKDLLSMLLEARDEETGESMSDEQVRHEVGTLLFAGHETTAVTLTWAFYLLSQNRAVENKLHAEVEQALQGRPPTIEDLPKLPYARRVIEETLRLYPPAWAFSRESVGPDEIGGYTIEAPSNILLSPWTMHRHPAFWESPEQFDPERFTPERSADRAKFAYFPFGGGPRICIGNQFAMTEGQLVLATIVQHYRLELVPGQVIEPAPIFVLHTTHGLRMMPLPHGD